MAAHTPGPWHVGGPCKEWVNDSRNMNICRVNATVSVTPLGKTVGDGDASRNANAHLIAAAPELLEACKTWAEMWRNNYPDPDDFERTAWQFRQIEEAVAKAEGGNE